MEIKNFYKRFLIWFVLCPALIIGLVAAVSVVSSMIDEEGTKIMNCAEDNGVWDHNENRCRDDCLFWTSVQGCIPNTKENAERLKGYEHILSNLRETGQDDFYEVTKNRP